MLTWVAFLFWSAVTTGSVIAAEATQAADPTGGVAPATWERLGTLGLVILAVITMQLVPGPIYRSLQKLYDEERTKNTLLEQYLRDKIVPIVEANTQTTKDSIALIKDVTDELRTERRRGR